VLIAELISRSSKMLDSLPYYPINSTQSIPS